METTIGWISKDTIWWIFTLPAFMGSQTLNLNIYTFLLFAFTCFSIAILSWASSTGGGIAWINGRNQLGKIPIPGPKGLPLVGSLFALSHGLPHRTLASMARIRAATCLMAFSAGSTPFVVSSEPQISKEILNSSLFADRPIKQSARSLLFDRAIGFSPNGAYWRSLRRIATSHLFSPCRISAHEPGRRFDSVAMLRNIETAQKTDGFVFLRKHLQLAALNNIMGTVFGKRYENNSDELEELIGIVSEGFELLRAFNWSDHLPWLSYFYDPYRIKERCMALRPRVKKLVGAVIEEHKLRGSMKKLSDKSDFVDVLLSLDGREKLQEDDMIAVLWEMIFRGTDTTALLTEWTIAELVRHPNIQQKLQKELDEVSTLTDADMARLPYLQSVVKETLRVHPPGPLLSWARLSTSDVHLSNGMVVPANTVAMVNMWAITHDPKIWRDPEEFNPDRFLGDDVDVRGGDLRLAPFGAGRRVCPGKNLGLVTVTRWVAELVKEFRWVQEPGHPVRLSETLKLSCEMKHPLRAVAIKRNITKN